MQGRWREAGSVEGGGASYVPRGLTGGSIIWIFHNTF